MMPGVSTDKALEHSEHLRNAVAKHPFPQREKQPLGFVSVSGGIACFPDHGRSIQDVVRLADTALYRAKESGRNNIMGYSPGFCVDEEYQPHIPVLTSEDDSVGDAQEPRSLVG
jgi:PleD family two-component response regulator